MKKENGQGAPSSRGGAGAYIEGELGALYLLPLLSGSEARGAPGSSITRVSFQGVSEGFALDDLVVHGSSPTGETLLEVQSKRTITFARRDAVFKEVCSQIASATPHDSVAEQNHLLAVATQRTSHRISGPYQDVLEWARAVTSAEAFFNRLTLKGVANDVMREFVESFRANLVSAGIKDDQDIIWRILRRFRILEFDFEAGASQARLNALYVARHALAPEDAHRAEGLWSALIDLALQAAKVGGSIDRESLRSQLVSRGFRLAGDRHFAQSRAKLEEMSRHALAEIDQAVSGVQLPRIGLVAAVNEARDSHRFVEIRGNAGVGKSSLLRQIADRISLESRIIVLDPVGTPDGGWAALASLLGVTETAKDFLCDLVVSGGAVLFIDSLEMFVDPGKRRTVNDLLREVSALSGFSVVVTARSDFGADGDTWLSTEALEAIGPSERVEIGEIDEAEVSVLSAQAPELRALLSPDHPAAPIARNLYRLSRLVRVEDTAVLRTEASLAAHWWETGDGIDRRQVRAAQRILADLADAAISGRDHLILREDSVARSHLLRSSTLREERRRDHMVFYHDVLRDWAVGMLIHEAPDILDDLDLASPLPGNIARGVEFGGRFALEQDADSDRWLSLLARLSEPGVHSSWRRNVLLAILRSELGPRLLEQNSDALLCNGGKLLRDLCDLTLATDTVPLAAIIQSPVDAGINVKEKVPRSLRFAVSVASTRLMRWSVSHASSIPAPAMGSVVRLGLAQFPFNLDSSSHSSSVAMMFYEWLRTLERRERGALPPDFSELGDHQLRRLVSELRSLCLLMASHASSDTKSYLNDIGRHEFDKIKSARASSLLLAAVAPDELSALIERSLIDPEAGKHASRSFDHRSFSMRDSDYLPPSPAQPPFLDLLQAAPDVGLALVRRLTQHALQAESDSADLGTDGFELIFDNGPRFFSVSRSYLWSRGHAQDYSVASALMALEAWGHKRIEAGELPGAVVADILGPGDSFAAYLLVAVDLLLSHWPATREALVPFLSCPALLAADRSRSVHDQMDIGRAIGLRDEPSGRASLESLRGRPSRGVGLERALIGYLGEDVFSGQVRTRLEKAIRALGSYGEDADFGDPAFMGAHALNVLDSSNWENVDGGRAYRPPVAEAKHIERLEESRRGSARAMEIDAKVSMAITERARGSAALAREAALHAAGDLPDGTDPDYLKSRSTFLISAAMLVARDGDDPTLEEFEPWVRQAVRTTLEEEIQRRSTRSDEIQFNRPALATCALIFLWCRRRTSGDLYELIAMASRHDHCAAPAFKAAIDDVLSAEPRLLKSILRVGIGNCVYQWTAWDADPEEKLDFIRSRESKNRLAVEAEVVWLNGGIEPGWPAMLPEEPSPRRSLRIPSARGARDAERSEAESRPKSVMHADNQAAALWLTAICDAQKSEIEQWLPQVVHAYIDWTAIANGLGCEADAEFDQLPTEWNLAFCAIAASVLLEAGEEEFARYVGLIEGLPDQTFCDIAEALLLPADIWYFNSPGRSADRPVRLRERLAQRAIKLRSWNRSLRKDELSVDSQVAPFIAALFMNSHGLGTGTTSYLVPQVMERIDPLLTVLSPLSAGGPTPFVARCLLNTLNVRAVPRHLEFLISAVESWFQKMPEGSDMWIEAGIGRRIMEWLQAASDLDESILQRRHSLCARIDEIVGKLVALGVADAYDFERCLDRAR